ncbi:hypothetical protein D3C81_916990 [compost metagenome]
MREADHGCFGHLRVRNQRAFHFGRTDAVAGDVDHVIDAASDPVIAIFIATAAVTGEIAARVGAEVGVDETLVVTVDGTHLARPRVTDDQIAFGRAFQRFAIGTDQRGLHAEEGQCRRAGLQVDRTGQWRDQDAAGLGLPPGIDDGAARIADHFVVPAPGFRIDRLTHAAKQAQAGTRGALDRCFAFAHQRTDGGRCGVEDGDLVLVDHFPEARGVGVVRHALEHHRGGAIGQRAVDDVAVAGDPAHVGGAPVDVVFAQVEHRFMRVRRIEQVATAGVQHALGLAGGTGGVKDEQRIFRVHAFRFAHRRLRVDDVVEPAIPRRLHVHRTTGMADHQHGFHGVGAGQLQCGVDVGLQRHLLATTQAFIGGDDQLAGAVADAVGDGVGGKPTKHHRVDRTDAGAGQHGHGGVDDHRQVDGDAVALLDAERTQCVAQAADAFVQLAVGDLLRRAVRAIGLEQDGGLVTTRGQLPVQAVDADVELTVLEPLDAEIVELVADVLDLGRLYVPIQALSGLGPECIGVVHRFAVQLLIRVLVDPGLGGECGFNGINISHGNPHLCTCNQ